MLQFQCLEKKYEPQKMVVLLELLEPELIIKKNIYRGKIHKTNQPRPYTWLSSTKQTSSYISKFISLGLMTLKIEAFTTPLRPLMALEVS